MSLLRARPLLSAFVGTALVLSGCGIRSSVEAAVEDAAEEAAEAAKEAAEEAATEAVENAVDGSTGADSAGADGPASDEPLDPTVIADADSSDEVTLPDGRRIAVAVQCQSLQGGNLIFTGMVGFAPGIHEGETEPAAGGGPDVGVAENGRGLSIRQTTLDQPSYTVTFPTIDSNISLTVDGCPQ